ncbi:MAG TPA: hypothetical protein DCQ57_02910, partial [Enterobacteriaceae bacterium]|nr:hypothetical protein [Enterobacteriaceae bacterium]
YLPRFCAALSAKNRQETGRKIRAITRRVENYTGPAAKCKDPAGSPLDRFGRFCEIVIKFSDIQGN